MNLGGWPNTLCFETVKCRTRACLLKGFLALTRACLRSAARDMTMEDREASAKSMYAEFLSGGDTAEALTCARELSLPGVPGCHFALTVL